MRTNEREGINLTRIEKINRLEELKKDREIAAQAMRDIASGKKQSYGVGTRNAAAYNMSLGELRAWKKSIEQEIVELKADLTGRSRRNYVHFLPGY
jgi:hypothetical protein